MSSERPLGVMCSQFEWTARAALPSCVCVCVCLPSYVMMMPFKRQALVEFSAVESADRCVSCGAKEPVYIAGSIPRLFPMTRPINYTHSLVCTVCVHMCFLRPFVRPTGVLQLLHVQENHQADQRRQPQQWQQGSAAVNPESPLPHHHGKHTHVFH